MATQAELNDKIGLLLDKWLAREEQQRTWLNGTVNGGPNGNGYYPLSDSSGFTQLQPCPAKVALIAATPAVIDLTGPGPFTLTIAQAGNRVRIGNGATSATIVVNVPVAPVGTVWFIRQRAAAPLQIVPPAGVNLRHKLGYNGTAGMYASAAICYEATDQVFLDGDVGLVA